MTSKVERAARIREALGGRTIAWLADAVGCALSTAHSYANGAVPPADVAFRIADSLGVDARWYVTGEGAKTSWGGNGVESVPLYDHSMQIVSEMTYSSGLLHSLGVPVSLLGCMLPQGNAMRPTVPANAEVLFSLIGDGIPEDGAVHVVRLGNHLAVRRLMIGTDGRWKAVCDNPAFRGEPKEDLPEGAVVGKVLWVSHRP